MNEQTYEEVDYSDYEDYQLRAWLNDLMDPDAFANTTPEMRQRMTRRAEEIRQHLKQL
jgi:hypothetical protein